MEKTALHRMKPLPDSHPASPNSPSYESSLVKADVLLKRGETGNWMPEQAPWRNGKPGLAGLRVETRSYSPPGSEPVSPKSSHSNSSNTGNMGPGKIATLRGAVSALEFVQHVQRPPSRESAGQLSQPLAVGKQISAGSMGSVNGRVYGGRFARTPSSPSSPLSPKSPWSAPPALSDTPSPKNQWSSSPALLDEEPQSPFGRSRKKWTDTRYAWELVDGASPRAKERLGSRGDASPGGPQNKQAAVLQQ